MRSHYLYFFKVSDRFNGFIVFFGLVGWGRSSFVELTGHNVSLDSPITPVTSYSDRSLHLVRKSNTGSVPRLYVGHNAFVSFHITQNWITKNINIIYTTVVLRLLSAVLLSAAARRFNPVVRAIINQWRKYV